MRRERVRPMPTEEEKARARLKAASMDPLVWAMKSVDAAFPDDRVKSDALPMDAEDIDDFDDEPVEPVADNSAEIKAEGKVAVPADDGVLTMEVTPMRQDVSDVPPEEVMAKRSEEKDAEAKKPKKIKKPKKKFDMTQKKMLVAVGLMSVATVAAVIFGVISIVRQGETTKELTEQIAIAQNNAQAQQADTVDGDYINLKDWGLRIKIVTGLTYISYNYESDEYSEVMIWGAKRDASANYSPEFVNQSKNGSSMGTVVRVPRYERAAAGRLIWYDDYYNYYYQGPSGVPNVSEDEMSWWVDSYLLIKEMLTNADNYEKYEQNTIGQS